MKVHGNSYQEVVLAWLHSPLVHESSQGTSISRGLMEWPFKVATLVIVTSMFVCDVFAVLSLSYLLSYMSYLCL